MKNVSARDLALAIRQAHAGKMTLAPEAGLALAHARTQAAAGLALSDREREVLKLMVDGLTNTEIAACLLISHSTVKYHIGNLLAKLQVDNRVAPVAGLAGSVYSGRFQTRLVCSRADAVYLR